MLVWVSVETLYLERHPKCCLQEDPFTRQAKADVCGVGEWPGRAGNSENVTLGSHKSLDGSGTQIQNSAPKTVDRPSQSRFARVVAHSLPLFQKNVSLRWVDRSATFERAGKWTLDGLSPSPARSYTEMTVCLGVSEQSLLPGPV